MAGIAPVDTGTSERRQTITPLHLTNLTIKGYRGLDTLNIEGLGHVTLLTGDNGIGKTSVLEAVRLLVDPSAVSSIFLNRGEAADRPSTGLLPASLRPIHTMFTGFPATGDITSRIELSSAEQPKVSIWVATERYSHEPSLFEDETTDPPSSYLPEDWRLSIQRSTGGLSQIRLGALVAGPRASDLGWKPRPLAALFPCRWYGTGGRGADSLLNLWDQIVLTDSERSVMEMLQLIDHRVTAVAMIRSDLNDQRELMVRHNDFARPIPLRALGEGMDRLFALAVSMISAKGGILLIDEFENGLHHRLQLALWAMLLKWAEMLHVQLIASTHSWDCISAFQQASRESALAGTLVRLSRRQGSVVATTFSEEELSIATRHEIEVR